MLLKHAEIDHSRSGDHQDLGCFCREHLSSQRRAGIRARIFAINRLSDLTQGPNAHVAYELLELQHQ